jgi:hypothetical protein
MSEQQGLVQRPYSGPALRVLVLARCFGSSAGLASSTMTTGASGQQPENRALHDQAAAATHLDKTFSYSAARYDMPPS